MKGKAERRSGLAGNESSTLGLINRAQEALAAEKEKAQGRDGRGRSGNSGRKGEDNQGTSKATYALPISRQELVRQIAIEEDCSQTDIVEAAIVLLHNLRQAGKIDLSALKAPIKSLRFSWGLEIPDNFFLDQGGSTASKL